MSRDDDAARAKRQHYVPALLLRRFACGSGKRKARYRLWVYDKWTERTYSSSVQKVAAENRFYDLTLGSETLSLESALADMESVVAPVIGRVVARKNLTDVSYDDRRAISLFVAIQLQRTPQDRYVREQLHEDLVTLCDEWGIPVPDDSNVASSESARLRSIEAIVKDSDYFAEILRGKVWALFEAPGGSSFVISDHPVVMANTIGHELRPHRGNLGLNVHGIEIYLPLSKTLTLGILCPSLVDLFRELAGDAESIRRSGGQLPPNTAAALAIHRQITNGLPVKMSSENVTYQNYLQVSGSFRYVYSARKSFELAEEMVQSDPRFRRGPALAFS